MCRRESSRRLQAMALLAPLACVSLLLLCAQGNAQITSNTTLPQQATTSQQPDATPEEIGDAYLARRRYQNAIAAYKQAPQDSAEVWNKMGIAYEMMFNLDDAMRCFKQSLRINPRDARVVNNLGTIYDAMKDYGAAGRMYRKALKLDPGSATIARNLGTNLLMRRNYKEGLEAYKRALALDPHIFDSRAPSTIENEASLEDRGAMNYYMAKSCAQAGQEERAIEYLRRAISEGYTSTKKIAEDSSFDPLHDNPAFKHLMATHKEQ